MCIELYLAINLVADLALLGAVSHVLGLFDWRKTAQCSVICAAYSLQAAVKPSPWASPVVQAILLATIALLMTRAFSFSLWMTALLSTACSALLCGGIARAAGMYGPGAALLCLAAGLSLSSLLFTALPPTRRRWQIWLVLSVEGKSVRFPALIDTGNRLREPLSGLPVLIAEAVLLEGLLPDDGYRVLRFGALGGEGRLACFKPSAVWIESGRRRRRAPEVWVAASPDPIPGCYRALAPPEFALCPT